MKRYEWNEETEDGRRYYAAIHHGGRWKFNTTLQEQYDWDDDIPHTEEILQTLRGILWAKYQRRRTTWKIVESVDKILKKEYGVEPPQSR